MADAFYLPDRGALAATELTRGPWDPGFQHGGPPAALLAREIEGLEDSEEFQVGRITFEILRAVPIAQLWAEARVVRPGKRVQLIESTLSGEEGPLIRASAWRLRTAPVELPELPAGPVPPSPEAAEHRDFVPTGQDVGYHTAMEYRFVEGAFREPGPAKLWMRMRHPLVAGEQPSPLQRVITAADSGNGVSATLDWRRFLFINVDLTVQLDRLPQGDWVYMDAVTHPRTNGVGVADTELSDQRGRIGRALQTLLIAKRD